MLTHNTAANTFILTLKNVVAFAMPTSGCACKLIELCESSLTERRDKPFHYLIYGLNCRLLHSYLLLMHLTIFGLSHSSFPWI